MQSLRQEIPYSSLKGSQNYQAEMKSKEVRKVKRAETTGLMEETREEIGEKFHDKNKKESVNCSTDKEVLKEEERKM